MQLLVIILLIFLNAFFAATEIAFISLNDAKIELQAEEGDKKAKTIREMLKVPSKFLATIQIGITFAGFLSSAFAADSFADKLAPIFQSWIPQLSFETWRTISIIVVTLILSYFSLVFGELVPKRIAMKNSEKLAYATIGIVRFISIITAPFVKLLTVSTNLVSKLFGVTETDEETVTEEEIRMMVDVGEEKGTIDESEKEMINNIFEFDDKAVSEVMVPRMDVYAIEASTTISDFLESLPENFLYSRVPVYDETIDNIVGIVYMKDVVLQNKNKDATLKSLAREAFMIPETNLINEAFEDLRKNHKQIAIVVDEYGGTSGIVTMEDMLEEIVGEIYDEYDVVDKEYKKVNGNTYILSGGMAIFDVEDLLDIKINQEDFDTLSGYLVDYIGKVPDENDKGTEIEIDNVTYTIMEVEDRHISKIKAVVHEKKQEEENEEE
jgi:putative hemolysin